MIPLLKPKLPNAEVILPYLKKIDENRWYSNRGPLASQLEERLAAFFHVKPNNIILTHNATSALTAALLACRLPQKTYCLVPSWTFAASIQSILMAGMIPYFVDVDEDAVMNREMCLALAKENALIGAAMVVMPFGAPINYKSWKEFQKTTGIPVIVDGAAGFASSIEGSLPTIVSLHATKIVGVGEGGFILSNSASFIERIWSITGFGFLRNERVSSFSGFNGKMSEYTAAVGHGMMDEVSLVLSRYYALAEDYRQALNHIKGLSLQKGFGKNWVSNALTVFLEDRVSIPALGAHFEKRGIEARCIWPMPCHLHKAFDGYPQTHLPQTEMFFKRAISLPFFIDITEEERDAVIEGFTTFLLQEASEIKLFGT